MPTRYTTRLTATASARDCLRVAFGTPIVDPFALSAPDLTRTRTLELEGPGLRG